MLAKTPPARNRLMQTLRGMLSPQGLLFLGHAEGGIAREFGFEPIPSPLTFAFRKIGVPAPAKPTPPRREPVAATVLVRQQGTLQPLPPVPVSRPRAKAAAPVAPAAAPVSLDTLLAEAERLADAGQLKQAQTVCAAALQAHGPSARTYYLLGLIAEAAASETEAEAFYRKTLYLEPDHYEALVQLSLLEKKRGDMQSARHLDERAGRAQRMKTP